MHNKKSLWLISSVQFIFSLCKWKRHVMLCSTLRVHGCYSTIMTVRTIIIKNRRCIWFNSGKCKVLRLGRWHPHYWIYDVEITEETDLDVIIDEMLKFEKRRPTGAQIICKANKFIALLRRSFETLDRETLVIFNAQVRPHLEYSNAVTYPKMKNNGWMVYKEERRRWSVRRRRMHMPANQLAVPSLAYRRKRRDIVEVYNYTDGLHNASALPVDVEENTRRGHSYKLNKKSVPPLGYRGSSRASCQQCLAHPPWV